MVDKIIILSVSFFYFHSWHYIYIFFLCVLLVNFNGGSFSAIFALTSCSSIFCIVFFLLAILQTINPYGMEIFLCLLLFIRTNVFLCNVERFLSPSFILKFLVRMRLSFWSRHFKIWNQNFLRNFWNVCLLISFNSFSNYFFFCFDFYICCLETFCVITMSFQLYFFKILYASWVFIELSSWNLLKPYWNL